MPLDNNRYTRREVGVRSTDEPVERDPAWQQRLERIVDAPRFGAVVIAVIVVNALVIGLETYPQVAGRYRDVLWLIDRAALAFFVVELLLRIAAAGFRPRRFLSRRWNVFDLLVVTAAFVPGLAANTTALRLVRLLRVARLLSAIPDMRVLLDGLRRAAPPASGLLLLTLLLLYLYGIVGWSLFHQGDPERWGTVGESMLTLFTLLTLEGWNEILAQAREVSPWALVFVLSFLLVGTFVVLNLVIGIVITSLDEAYAARRRAREGAQLADTITRLREALDDLERRIEIDRPPPPKPQEPAPR